jgi:type IV secretory pathway VirD2 relaxase
MMSDENEFQVRPGKAKRSTNSGRAARGLIAEVLRVAIKSGAGRSHGWAASPRRGQSSFGRGRTSFARSRLFGSGRRAVVKVLPVRQRGVSRRMAPMAAHIAYLKREGVTRDGSHARMFDADSDRADEQGFAERCKDDRHHFRIIVSPEDAADLTDLREYTRDLARQMEADLGTRIDWVAVDHWNTDNPHVHMLLRGVDDNGHDLVISRDYISHGLRSRAEELASIELGPKPEHEMERALGREVCAERWTRLDGEIRYAADELGVVDLRPEFPQANDPRIRRLMIGRLQHLETMGLAHNVGPGQWVMAEGAQVRLRELGTRGDIIGTMGKALADRAEERALANYVIDGGTPERPIIGRLIDKGLHDELSGTAYAVIDGTDGRVHHVRFKGVEAFSHDPPLGGIVEVRAIGREGEVRPTLVLAVRSDIDLGAQITAPGATWIDHRLIERGAGLSEAGFGSETRRAMEARTDHLIAEGLAKRHGSRIVFADKLIDTLRAREVDKAGANIARQTGLPYRATQTGEQITGVCRQRLALASGRFAMIESLNGDGGLGFSLVPWTNSLERQLGRQVSGIIRDGGGIDWTLGRKRGLGI